MKPSNRSSRPARHEQAIFNPSCTLDKYTQDIIEANDYWGREFGRAGKIGSGALLTISGTFCNNFISSTNTWNELGRSPNARGVPPVLEQARRTALSTLGVSILLRSMWAGTEVEPDFIEPQDQEGIILDMIVNTDAWQDFRIHTPSATENPLPSDTNEQWYKQDGLWIRQIRPGTPTDHLQHKFLPALGLELDFSRLETLFPYVAARP